MPEPFNLKGKIVPLSWLTELFGKEEDWVIDTLEELGVSVHEVKGLRYILGNDLMYVLGAENPDTKKISRGVEIDREISDEEVQEVLNEWNRFAEEFNLNKVFDIYGERRDKIVKLIQELEKRGLSFSMLLERIKTLDAFWFGNNERLWKINFNYLLKEGSIDKILNSLRKSKKVEPKREDDEEVPF